MSARARALTLCIVLPLAAVAPAGGEPPDAGVSEARSSHPLRLEEVLASVQAHFPLLRAAEAELAIARGARKEAEGAFDTRLGAAGDFRPLGYYENRSGGATFEQPTRLWGARFFGGYRIGRGDFPSYDGDRKTDAGGEIRGGVEIPLLRGGPTDEARVQLWQAEIDEELAGPQIALERIEVELEAASAYWRWVANGRSVVVTDRLLRVAEARQAQFEGRVARGALAPIDLVDNERLVVDRRIRLRGSERDLEQASIGLSLYWRDANGAPRVPGRDRIPPEFPRELMVSDTRFEADVAQARERHPLVRRLAFERERVERERDLARNELLPALDLRIEGSKDYGDPSQGISSEGIVSSDPRGEAEFQALLRFEIPVQRREARGRLVQATARLSRIDNELRFARERIEAEVRQAMAGLAAAYAQTGEARRNLELALELQGAEERKLLLGTSNLINVNIREVQAAEAGLALIETQADFFRALAEYGAATASSPGR